MHICVTEAAARREIFLHQQQAVEASCFPAVQPDDRFPLTSTSHDAVSLYLVQGFR